MNKSVIKQNAHNSKLFVGLKQTRLASLFAVFFLFAQIITTAHNAAYGEADHSHDGHPCIISTVVKTADDIDCAPTTDSLPDQNTYGLNLDRETGSLVSFYFSFTSARAPPKSLS